MFPEGNILNNFYAVNQNLNELNQLVFLKPKTRNLHDSFEVFQ